MDTILILDCETTGTDEQATAIEVACASAHRAMADCDLLARLFTRVAEMGADLDDMLAHGLRPKATFQALVSYESNHLAKTAGFRWNAEKRVWARKMAIEDAAALPFKVREIAGT
jgi:DNA polymerase-3 subunit epsilon